LFHQKEVEADELKEKVKHLQEQVQVMDNYKEEEQVQVMDNYKEVMDNYKEEVLKLRLES